MDSDAQPDGGATSVDVTSDHLNRLVMNYLVSEGFKEAAEKFAEESGVEPRENETSEHLDARIAIRQAILDGGVEAAIAGVNELRPQLLDDDRCLHFRLLQQQMIELVRQGQLDDALQFAQDNLVEKGEQLPTLLEEIERTLALLAFDTPERSPFSDLMEPTHRLQVANEVNAALLRLLPPTDEPSMEFLVQMVLWAQEQLERKRVPFRKMTDVGHAIISDVKVNPCVFSAAIERPHL